MQRLQIFEIIQNCDILIANDYIITIDKCNQFTYAIIDYNFSFSVRLYVLNPKLLIVENKTLQIYLARCTYELQIVR